ncbi:hypothetical protein Tco_0352607 [Tanacetum coccineum]
MIWGSHGSEVGKLSLLSVESKRSTNQKTGNENDLSLICIKKQGRVRAECGNIGRVERETINESGKRTQRECGIVNSETKEKDKRVHKKFKEVRKETEEESLKGRNKKSVNQRNREETGGVKGVEVGKEIEVAVREEKSEKSARIEWGLARIVNKCGKVGKERRELYVEEREIERGVSTRQKPKRIAERRKSKKNEYKREGVYSVNATINEALRRSIRVEEVGACGEKKRRSIEKIITKIHKRDEGLDKER